MFLFRYHRAMLAICAAVALIVATPLFQGSALGQAITMNGGSIQGTVTDPSGAVVPGATITITNPNTGFSKTLTSDAAGYYSLGPLVPGSYSISVDANGFQHVLVNTTVSLGTVSSGSVRLQVGSKGTTVEVSAGDIQVNTDQIGVAGVVSQQQIDTLPVNGRNILDVAQIQPGVILQSGMSFDPTKAGYSAISVSGVGGRTTRILFDGQDITDETVGTTIFNVPTGAVGEAQLNRSTQDVSGEVTSTGQMLISTRSGSNKFHGNTFYNFQDDRAGFATIEGAPAPFQRNQFGGYVGGPILKDKLFFYGGGERIKQEESDVAVGANPIFAPGPDGINDPTYGKPLLAEFPFTPAPFRDNFSMARLDYNGPHGINMFVRAAYSVNADFSTFGYSPYALYESRNNVPALVGGVDFVRNQMTHSFRIGYEKFHNLLGDGTGPLGSAIYNPSTGPQNQISLVGDLNAGPNFLAPQGTFQSDKQFRYDGTWVKGRHTLKFGGEINRILGGGFAAFFGPSLYTVLAAAQGTGFEAANCGDVAGAGPCPGDPTKGWISPLYILGNGNGFFTEKPGFNLPGGGSFSWRMAAYIGDTWKANPNLTLTAGLRWSVDTDRANQDVPSPTCGEVDPSLQFPGCDGTDPNAFLFDQYQKGLGGKVNQPYHNFGPQLGFVFSPGAHHTSYRGGIGIYYESDVFNNTGNARPGVITANGPYFGYGVAAAGNTSIDLPGFGTVSAAPDGTPVAQILSETIFNAAPELNAIKAEYQAKVKGADVPNGNFVGTGGGLFANNLYAHKYQSPYSIQINGGVQHEFTQGVLVSADYVHNGTLRVPISVDVNHVGAARTLNTAAAQNAIAATNAAFGCGASWNSAAIDCAIKAGAHITDYASFGLDSGSVYLGGYPAAAYGLSPNGGAAFAGDNPNLGEGLFILPQGRSGYDALQVVAQEQKSHPFAGVVDSNMQISYSFSRIVTSSTSAGGQDQFFAGARTYDNDNPNKYIGRSNLDHTSELSFGGSGTLRYGPRLGMIGHFFSAPPTTMTLDTSTAPAGGIFVTDMNGDGQVGDLLPGTNPGDYMHAVKGSGLNKAITAYNNNYAGKPTPAGQAVISAGLFSASQLSQLGGVAETLALQPNNHPRNNPAFRTFDANLSYPIHLKWLGETTTITPGVAFYNVFNLANYGGVGGTVLVDPNENFNQVNSSYDWANSANNYRVTRNSGTFDQGGPRSGEWDLRIDF